MLDVLAPFILPLLILLNGAISYFNATQIGKVWPETKAMGGFYRLLAYSAATMSVCGFMWIYFILLGSLAFALGKLGANYLEMLFSLGYLVIILPLLGSGMVIWVHSLAVAYRERNFTNMGIATWNTFSQIYNTYSAVKTVPTALGNVIEGFEDGDEDDAKLMLVIAIVMIAALGGILTTYYLIMRSAKKHAREMKAEIREIRPAKSEY